MTRKKIAKRRKKRSQLRKKQAPRATISIRRAEPSNTATARQARARPIPPPSRPKRFIYWELEGPHRGRAKLPAPLSPDRSEKLSYLLALGGVERSSGTPNGRIPVFIGLDFGTSCTKIIAHFRGTRSLAYAVEIPEELRLEDQPYLLGSYVWLQPDGSFSLWPRSDSVAVDGIKTGLMSARVNTVAIQNGDNVRTTYLEAAVAYLALVIRYARGYLTMHHSDAFQGKSPAWATNLGLPAANYERQALLKRYRLVAVAALALADQPTAINVTTVRATMNSDEVGNAAQSNEAAVERGVSILPEVVAEAVGFTKSTGRVDGLYAMVDVGAATLDACTFRLKHADAGGNRHSLLVADVKPLGADAETWFEQEGRPKEGFVSQCSRMLRSVIFYTKKVRDRFADDWKPGHSLPLFLCGGGVQNATHKEVVAELDTWLSNLPPQNSGIQFLRLECPQALLSPVSETEFQRLAVAWGLSFPPFDIGDVVLPRDLDDPVGPTPVDVQDRYVGAEQV